MKYTDIMKQNLPEKEDKLCVEDFNTNFQTLENVIINNLISQTQVITTEATLGVIMPPCIIIKNLSLEPVSVVINDETVEVSTGKTTIYGVSEPKELNISTNSLIEVTYYVSTQRYIEDHRNDEAYSKTQTDELLDDKANVSDVYNKTEADNLLFAKSDKTSTYTKSETDSKITEKVTEIVAGAPEDFDTLKEMSDWLIEHEDSAAAMNSEIQQNKTDIATKVDKVPGKSLISDSEITRLASVDNYDDTSVNAQIADIYNRCGGGKNLFDFKNTSHSGSVGNEYTKNEDSFIITDSTKVWSRTAFKLGTLPKGKYYVSFKVADLECESNTTKVLVGSNSDGQQPIGVSGNITENKTYTFEFNVTSTTQIYYLVLYGNHSDTVYHNKVTFSEIMVYSSTIKNNTYVPYAPTNAQLQNTINNHIQTFNKAAPKPGIAFERKASFIIKPLSTNEYRTAIQILLTSQYGNESPKEILLTINTKTGVTVGKGVLVGYQHEGSLQVHRKSLDDGTVLYTVDVGRASSYGNIEIYINRYMTDLINISNSNNHLDANAENVVKVSFWSVQDQLKALETRIAALETATTTTTE